MDQATVAPALKKKPSGIWTLIVFIAGAAGALGAVAAGGKGTYDVEPFRFELRAKPAPAGETQLAVEVVPGLTTGHAEAPTHSSPLEARVTVVGVSNGFLSTDADAIDSPRDLASYMGNEARSAVRSFAIKCGILAASGGAAAGAALSLFGMRWRRVVGGALAGLLTFGIIGALMQQTYDANQFANVRFVPSSTPAGDTPLDLTP